MRSADLIFGGIPRHKLGNSTFAVLGAVSEQSLVAAFLDLLRGDHEDLQFSHPTTISQVPSQQNLCCLRNSLAWHSNCMRQQAST